MPIQAQDPTLLLVQDLVKVQTFVSDGEQADVAFLSSQGQFTDRLEQLFQLNFNIKSMILSKSSIDEP